MANAEPKIHQICTALERYYAKQNKPYDKLFSIYCEDNGFDDDALEEELQATAEDSMVTDFDDDFPFDKEMKNDEEKNEYIFQLILKCNNNPDINFNEENKSIKFDTKFFSVDDKDIEAVSIKYKKQCPEFWDKGGLANDLNLLRMLAIGHKYDIQYLKDLVDDLQQAKLNSVNKSLTQNEWTNKNPHFKDLSNIKVYPLEQSDDENASDLKNKAITANVVVNAAITSFQTRFIPSMKLRSRVQINSSLEITVKYIDGAITYVSNQIKNANKTNKAACPFQIDLVIATGETLSVKKTLKMIDDYDDDDGKKQEEKVDDNSDNSDDSDDNKQYDEFVDVVGDIKAQLEQNDVKYAFSQYNPDDSHPVAREFGSLQEDYRKSNSSEENKQTFVHRKRFVFFVDRRKSGGKMKYKLKKLSMDDIWLYEPPNAADIPHNAVSEWSIYASRSCILPKQKSSIGSLMKCKGSLLTMSIYAETSDIIKCYLYWNGGGMRFFPEDIATVLPQIFNMEWNNDENQKFIDNREEIKRFIKEMTPKVPDVTWDKSQQLFR
eukprot:388594_1